MPLKGFQRRFKPLEILSEADVETIVQATLRVLERTGVVFDDQRALKVLGDHGCAVDMESRRVRIPESLAWAALAKCPRTFEARARDPRNNVVIGDPARTYFFPSNGMQSVDLDTWQPKLPTRREFYDYMKILDALPNVHGMPSFPWYGFAGLPQCMSLIESCAAKMRMSAKVQIEGAVMGNDRWIIAMAKATGQDIFQLVNPAAPLFHGEDVVTKVLTYAEEDMPFHISSGPVGGATGPATVAGTLVSCSAEHVSGFVLAQLVKPGARVWSASGIRLLNMRTGSPWFGQVGNFLADAAFHQVWRRFGVPTTSSAAGYSGSKAIDYQAAYEQTMAATTSALAGASVVRLQGGLTQQLTAHPLKAILDDDVVGMIGRFLQGVEVNEQTLAVDVIDEVGPLPGSFLLAAHTRQFWQQDQYLPSAADHRPHADWARLGSKKALDLAKEKMAEILATHQTPALPADQEQAIEDILNEARQYYRAQGKITDEEWAASQKDLASPNYPYG